MKNEKCIVFPESRYINSNTVINKSWILLLGIKRNLGISLEKNICQKKEDKIWLKWKRDHITIEEWFEEFLDNKSAFYNGRESDDSDNDDENYNENIEVVVSSCSSK